MNGAGKILCFFIDEYFLDLIFLVDKKLMIIVLTSRSFQCRKTQYWTKIA